MAAFASLRATFRVITPMFLGDVERRASRFSVASFKDALQFWWGACAYPRWLQQDWDATGALAALRRCEAVPRRIAAVSMFAPGRDVRCR